MTFNLRAVFTHAAPEVDEVEFNEYYDRHLGRILTYDGFVAARRYHLTPAVGSASPAGYAYLSIYEIEGDPIVAHSRLRADVVTGNIDHPAWFKSPRRSSWNCYAMDDTPSTWLLDQLILVLSETPASTDPDTYATGYRKHLDRHLGYSGVETGGRFVLTTGDIDAEAPSSMTFLALYAVTDRVEPRSLLPERGDVERFVVLEATSLAPAQGAMH